MFCFVLQNVSIVAQYIFQEDVVWVKSKASIETIITNLPEDDYFVSLGKPRGHCNILMDGSPIFTGKGGVPDKRISLLVGSSFRKDGSSKKVSIDCLSEMSGFKLYLAHSPFIAKYEIGMAIHLMRAISEVILGPFSSIILLLMLSYAHFFIGAKINSKEWVFAFVAFAYSLSLSYITRLFLDGESASTIHVVLRFAFSYSAYLILNEGLKNRPIVLLHHLIVTAGALWISGSSADLHLFYQYAHPTLLLPFCLSFYDRQSIDMRDRKHLYFSVFTVGWILAQSLDAINVWVNFGVYNSPMLIMVLSLTYGVMILETHRISQKIHNLQNQLSRVLKDKQDVPNLIQGIREVLFLHSHLPTITAYIDGMIIGKTDSVGEIFSLIAGDAPHEIKANDEQFGKFMFKSIDSGKAIIEKGKRDNNWFIVLPIGSYCCLNLTTPSRVTDYHAYETFDLLKKIQPWLDTAVSKMIELSHRQNGSLQKLRSLMEPGSYTKTTGAIFIDIADYSKHTETFGNDYPAFISSVYFPTLIKAISNWAIPEVVRGDEIYFVILKELCNESYSTDKQLINSLRKLLSFIENDGRTLCIAHGYPVTEMRIGLSLGEANIVVDDVQVRTSGDHINRAKRLQESAAKNEIWIESAVISQELHDSLILLSKKNLIVKKNIIEAVKVGVKRAA